MARTLKRIGDLETLVQLTGNSKPQKVVHWREAEGYTTDGGKPVTDEQFEKLGKSYTVVLVRHVRNRKPTSRVNDEQTT